MKNKLNYLYYLITVFLFSPVFFVSAAGLTEVKGNLTTTGGKMGYNTSGGSLETVVGNVIQALMGLLGVIFLGLIIYGGFKWMIARGNEKDVTEAKEIMINGTIGLVIVLSAYAITTYIISALLNNLDVIQ